MHTDIAIATLSPTQTRWSKPQMSLGLKIIQKQVGHRFASTTAIYTGVSNDFMNTMMRKALDRAFTEQEA
jgi:integrase